MSASSLVRVLCVDDNALVAEAIIAKLRSSGGFEWIGNIDTTDDLVATALRAHPDIILLDLDLPGGDPLDAAAALSRAGCAARIIVFSGHVSPELFERSIRAGAWGYISKSDGEEALVEGIRSVADGAFALSPEVEAICQRHDRFGEEPEDLFMHLLTPPAGASPCGDDAPAGDISGPP